MIPITTNNMGDVKRERGERERREKERGLRKKEGENALDITYTLFSFK